MPTPDEKILPPQAAQSVVQLGLRANWQQFTLLVIVNAFVGGMVGLERSIVPLLGQRAFGLASTTAVLSFIVSFGVVKAASNLFAGRLSDRIGRKGALVVGWLVGLPVPLLIIFAPSWSWVVFATLLLRINQGLCWSTTVIMLRALQEGRDLFAVQPGRVGQPPEWWPGMGSVSALLWGGRASSRADRAAGGHLSGPVGRDAVAGRGAFRPHWAQRHDCRGDAAS